MKQITSYNILKDSIRKVTYIQTVDKLQAKPQLVLSAAVPDDQRGIFYVYLSAWLALGSRRTICH